MFIFPPTLVLKHLIWFNDWILETGEKYLSSSFVLVSFTEQTQIYRLVSTTEQVCAAFPEDLNFNPRRRNREHKTPKPV